MSTAAIERSSPEDTSQRVHVNSPEWKKFLRAVLRDVDQWSCRASADSDWCLTFRRTIKGNVGCPDVSVEVCTDCQVATQHDRDVGLGKSFHDSYEVALLRVAYLHWSPWEVKHLVAVLTQDATLSIEAHRGSVNSSRHGIGFYSLDASIPKPIRHSVTLDSVVTVHGETVTSGVINFRRY